MLNSLGSVRQRFYRKLCFFQDKPTQRLGPREMERFSEQSLSEPLREKPASAITYFRNHKHPMRYPRYQAQHVPIGSEVIGAACKTLVKQRLWLLRHALARTRGGQFF